MVKYISNRQKNLKIGISSYTENTTVLEVTGNVGIGTTNATSKLHIVGDITASSANLSNNLSVTGVVTIGSSVTINSSGINIAGILTASSGIQGIGIQSGGTNITTGIITALNFVGSAISTVTISSGIVTVTVESGAFSRTTTSFTASAEQTIFSINYTPGFIDVYVNGVRLTSSEYIATNGTSVILYDGANLDDTIDITVYQDDGLYSASKWTPGNGDDIYRLNGNVGIGTDTGNARLDIEGVLGIDATVTGISTIAATTIDTLPIATYRSARFQVQITQSTDYQSTDLMVIHNGTTSNIIEYGSIATNDYLSSFSSTISGSNLLLQATMSTAGIANVKVVRYGVTI